MFLLLNVSVQKVVGTTHCALIISTVHHGYYFLYMKENVLQRGANPASSLGRQHKNFQRVNKGIFALLIRVQWDHLHIKFLKTQ